VTFNVLVARPSWNSFSYHTFHTILSVTTSTDTITTAHALCIDQIYMHCVVPCDNTAVFQTLPQFDAESIGYICMMSWHRLLKLRTDGGQSGVRKLGSIDFVLWLIIAVQNQYIQSYGPQIWQTCSQGQSGHDPLKIFWKGGVARVTWPLNFWKISANYSNTVKATDFKFGRHVPLDSLHTVKILIQAGSQIEARSPLQAGGLGNLF